MKDYALDLVTVAKLASFICAIILNDEEKGPDAFETARMYAEGQVDNFADDAPPALMVLTYCIGLNAAMDLLLEGIDEESFLKMCDDAGVNLDEVPDISAIDWGNQLN
jgi:hypothetical protein